MAKAVSATRCVPVSACKSYLLSATVTISFLTVPPVAIPQFVTGWPGRLQVTGMPAGVGAGLFAVARCAGWVAHVLEQYETGHLLRPRARYRPPP